MLPATGGAVQGSVLGVMDHNAVRDIVNESFLSDSHKYIDDLTSTEAITPTALGYKHQDELGGAINDVYHAAMFKLNLHSLAYCIAIRQDLK